MTGKLSWLVYNGEIVTADAIPLNPLNRAFLYGDSVFETLHFMDDRILFAEDHLLRLRDGLEYLGLERPAGITSAGLKKTIKKLILLNQISGEARVRLTVFRKDGGFYIPAGSQSSYIITVSLFEGKGFELNRRGLDIASFSHDTLALNHHRNNKTGNCIPFIRAGLFAREQGLDDALLLNSAGNIAEATSSNIFIIRKGIIITPPLYDGCVAGVMRKNLLRILKEEGMQYEETSIGAKALRDADEVFLTNVMHGIRWVATCDGRRKKAVGVKKLVERVAYYAGSESVK